MTELLTVSEVADIFRVDAETVRRWAKQGTIEAVFLPGKGGYQGLRFKREVLDKLLGKINEQN